MPFVGLRKATPERVAQSPNMPPAPGAFCPVTVIINFDQAHGSSGTNVTVELYNPKNSTRQLAADFSAPLELLLHGSDSSAITRLGLLHPFEAGITGLFMTEPYTKGKIPVVFVHGLDSAPNTWADVYNDLMADPVVRSRYQFWFFRYPTGSPILLSASQFRDSLKMAKSTYDPKGSDPSFDDMVVIGHSMGGMLTRLMVTESGDVFWNNRSNAIADEALLTPSDHKLLQHALFFHPQPFIKRVVFISTPHRGSDLADSFPARVANSIINTPGSLIGIGEGIASANGEALKSGVQGMSLKLPTSIENLSPSNNVVRTLQVQPVYAPFHTIAGDHGITIHGQPESDGVVPYTSAHLDGAQSELVLPVTHSAHKDPRAIAEIDRILRLHLSQL